MFETYLPRWDSIRTHCVPQWYSNAKFGIFLQWGLYSVPAFASTKYPFQSIPFELEWFTHNAFSEYYLNALRIKGSPTWEYHKEKYGEDFPYEGFKDLFTCENWDPEGWANEFKVCGARYVVLTTKHHEGYCLWPSAYTDYNCLKSGPRRDLLGELNQAVIRQGMRMGTHYSGHWDWTFTKHPMTTMKGLGWPDFGVQTYAYADYAYNQLMELIDHYHPSILWCDNGWPLQGEEHLKHALAHFYNTVPEGVINDRWNGFASDFSIREITMGNIALDRKWEQTRCIGMSYGYNRMEGEAEAISCHDIVKLLVETVAQNGNLMVNLGPRADGTIPELQLTRIRAIGKWLSVNEEAIYDTVIWQDRQKTRTTTGEEVFFTRTNKDLYLMIDGLRQGENTITIPGVIASTKALTGLNAGEVQASDCDSGLRLKISNFNADHYIAAIKVSDYF